MIEYRFRGHLLQWVGKDWDNGKWVYADNGEDVPANGISGKIRPCKKCGAVYKQDAVDPCLGKLPGVDNACCGHGIREYSYIRFNNGVVIGGFSLRSEEEEDDP